MEARDNLLDFQASLPMAPLLDQFQEEALGSVYSKSLKEEEVLIKQKCRIHWLKHGDGNNWHFLILARANGTPTKF